MKNKIITIITTLIFTLGLGTTFLVNPTHAADCLDVCCSNAPQSVKASSGCPGTKTDEDLPSVIVRIINSVIISLGVVAVVVIVIGGILYMTSSGDPAKTKRAKDTILYAVIGLVVCVLAFAIVNFTIGIIRGQNGNGEEGSSEQKAASLDIEKNIAFLEKTL